MIDAKDCYHPKSRQAWNGVVPEGDEYYQMKCVNCGTNPVPKEMAKEIVLPKGMKRGRYAGDCEGCKLTLMESDKTCPRCRKRVSA